MNSIQEEVSNIDALMGKNYVKDNPCVMAAIIRAQATKYVSVSIDRICHDMCLFDPQLEAISSAIYALADATQHKNTEDISYSIEKVAQSIEFFADVIESKK